MNNTEDFRTELRLVFAKSFGAENAAQILTAMDTVLDKYDVTKRETSLVPAELHVKQILADYAACMAIEGKKQGTVSNYMYILKEFFRTVQRPVEYIETRDARSYAAWLNERGLKPATIMNKERVVSRFFKWCMDEEIIQHNPFAKIKPVKAKYEKRVPLNDVESVQLESSCVTRRELAVITMFSSTGCRISELCNLKKEDIDFRSREIHIKHAKGDKDRTVLFDAKFELALTDYFNSRDDISPYAFVTTKKPHRKLTTHAMREEFERVVNRSGINRHITPHYMRHTFITDMLNHGAHPNIVAEIVGHASVNTTCKVYGNISNEEIRTNYRLHHSA